MKRLLIVLMFLHCSIAIAQAPNIEWRKTFSTDRGDNEGWMVQETRDDGFIIVGQNGGYNGHYRDSYIIKTDSNGDTLWTRSYEQDTDEYGRAIRQTPDGGYIVTGFFWNSNQYGDDIFLRKIDSLGNTLWRHIYQFPPNDDARTLELTTNGGFILAGSTQSPSNVLVVRTDSIGDTIWARQYGGIYNDRPWSIKNTYDGGFIIAGWSNLLPVPQENSQVYVIKINSDGDTIWTRRYGTPYNDEARSILELPDHKFIVAGKFGTGSGTAQAMLLCLDENGDSLWSRAYDSNYEASSVARTFDGGFILCGYNFERSNNIYSEFVRKTDSTGNSLWNISGEDSTYAHYIIQTSDSGYVFTGYAADSVSLTKIRPENSTGVHIKDKPQKGNLNLKQNIPNPFNLDTQIGYVLPEFGHVTLKIYDLLGQEVACLINTQQEQGIHRIDWNAGNLPSGLYFYRIKANNYAVTKKMTLMK